jgi:hypothetical protein
MMLIIVVLMTLAFAVSGAGTGAAVMGGIGGLLGFIVGGAIGFISASVLAAYFFLLSEIADNTRRS